MKTRYRILPSLLIAISTFFVMAACQSDEGPLSKLETSESYTMELTMYDVPGMNGDIEIVYKHSVTDKYMRIASEETYDVLEDNQVYRYETNAAGRFEKTAVDPEENPLIEPDTVVFDPEDLTPSILEEGNEEDVLILSEEGYDALFGDKASAVSNFALKEEEDGALRIVYTFRQDRQDVMVEASIHDWDETEINPPFD